MEFIRNFTSGDLSRHLRMPVRKLPACKTDGDTNICVEEVTTSTFSDLVLTDTKVHSLFCFQIYYFYFL